MAWPQTCATQYHAAQLGLPDQGRPIKELIVCNNWDLESLGCYQSFPDEVLLL